MWNEFESTVFCDTGNGTSIFNNGTCPGVFIPPSWLVMLFLWSSIFVVFIFAYFKFI